MRSGIRQWLHRQAVGANFGTSFLCHTRNLYDDVDGAGKLGHIAEGSRQLLALSVHLDLYLADGDSFCRGHSTQQLTFFVHSQLKLRQTLQSIDGHGRQCNLRRGLVAGFVGGLELQSAFFGEFVSVVDGLGGAFSRGKCKRDLASGGNTVLPRCDRVLSDLQLAVGEGNGRARDDVHRLFGHRDDGGLCVLCRGRVNGSYRRWRSWFYRLRTAAGESEGTGQ